MTSKLELFNIALGHLGQERLANLNENTHARLELDAVYPAALAAILEKANWKCALRSSELTYDSGISPAFGKPYAIAKPSDFVRLANFSVDPYFQPEGEIQDYEDEGGYWYSNQQIVYVRYVSNGATYGLDIGAWPQRLADLGGLELAQRAAIPISKDRGDRNDMLALSEKQLRVAKILDAIGEPVKRKPAGRLVTSRLGHRGQRIEPLRTS